MGSAIKINKAIYLRRYLGCDVKTFKRHLAEQFEEGMSWDNYGKWEIDHIIPMKYKNPSIEEIIVRLHYTNTQPMWKSQNSSKKNRYIGKYRPTSKKKSTSKKKKYSGSKRGK
jgi:hypothetical protein